MQVGAVSSGRGKWKFVVWAPEAKTLKLSLADSQEAALAMKRDARGYFSIEVENLESGTQYFYEFEDGRKLPDPASRFQPKGVHGPSALVAVENLKWRDESWRGRSLESSVFYELHVGTYTGQGTFEALIPHLRELRRIGITTIELMPIAQFPGARNWGYDGVQPFAPQNSYGGPEGLCKLVNAAHSEGLAVVLDVVYNHLGPEGNYFSAYGPYFTDRYQTPWGKAINFDGPDSEPVRDFFIENALYWLEKYHIDGLRLDAIHGIYDFGAKHFLAELRERVEQLAAKLGRPLQLIAESDLNDARILSPGSRGGYGLQGQWSDDFHHALHSVLTGERAGYYADFGDVRVLAETLRKGWFYCGQYSEYRRRRHGNSTAGLRMEQFVICSQNHDQIGNRARGERLSQLVTFEAQKLAAGVTLLSPFTPLLFMGEEYGETAPFQYFTSHTDEELIAAVRRGRAEEFSAFAWQGEVPDPHNESTFEASKLHHELKAGGGYQTMLNFYEELMRLRSEYSWRRQAENSWEESGSAITGYWKDASGLKSVAMIFQFAREREAVKLQLPGGTWRKRLDSAEAKWAGRGAVAPAEINGQENINLAPQSLAVFELYKSSPG